MSVLKRRPVRPSLGIALFAIATGASARREASAGYGFLLYRSQ